MRFLFFPVLLLSSCQVNGEDVTWPDVGSAVVKGVCQSVSNCGVAQGEDESKSRH